ncbi:MAG TPA: signal peptidase I [Bacillota bacterium]|nr:signal peptidase I [Bacillota bacterium]
MKRIFKIINNMVTTLLFIFLILMIGVVISIRASGEGGPEFLGYQFKTVLSGSMEPDILTGSVIAIKPVDEADSFQKGDVITYRTEDNTLVTHRIVEVKNEGKQYITQGDNNDDPDAQPVLRQNIVGTYTGLMIPYLGYATHFANTREGSALLLILPGLVLISYACYTIWDAMRQIENSA